MTAAQQQIVQQAVDRWEQIIVGDLPDVTYRGQAIDDLSIDHQRHSRSTARRRARPVRRPPTFGAARTCPTSATSSSIRPTSPRWKATAACWASSSTKSPTCWASASFGATWACCSAPTRATRASPARCDGRVQRDFRHQRDVGARRGRRRIGHRAVALGRNGLQHRTDDRLVQLGPDESDQPDHRCLAGRPRLPGQHGGRRFLHAAILVQRSRREDR